MANSELRMMNGVWELKTMCDATALSWLSKATARGRATAFRSPRATRRGEPCDCSSPGGLRVPFSILVIAAAFLAGCAEQPGGKAAAWQWPQGALLGEKGPPVESNIVRVNKFFSQTPWVVFDNDGSKRVDGVSFSVYLEGPGAPKGVFGTGTIVVNMYRLDVDPLGREAATPLHEWVMPPEEIYYWRAKKETALGWGYGLRLRWPGEIDVAGRQVAFVIKYLREDGRAISSSRQVMKVPDNSVNSAMTRTAGQGAAPPRAAGAPPGVSAGARPGGATVAKPATAAMNSRTP